MGREIAPTQPIGSPTPREPAEKEVLSELQRAGTAVEMTVITITQSLVLGILAGTSIEPILKLRIEYWPYIFISLGWVSIVWSRAVIHVLSYPAWPPKFARVYAYFGTAFVESIAVRQILNPTLFFLLGAIFTGLGVVLYRLDLTLFLRDFQRDGMGPGDPLYDDVLHDQLFHMRILLPVTTAALAVSGILMSRFPTVFLETRWHLALGGWLVLTVIWWAWDSTKLMARRGPMIFEHAVHLRLAMLLSEGGVGISKPR